MSCRRLLLALLLVTCASSSYAQSGFENLGITIQPPVCFGDACAVQVRFANFQTLNPALLASDQNLRTCGKRGTNSISTADFDPKGKSRTIVTVRSDQGLIEKNCNPDFMPKMGMKSGVAYRTFYFDADALPRFLKFVFRDRKNLVSRTLKANVPPVAPTSDYPCERLLDAFGTYSNVRNLNLERGELYTLCFDKQPRQFPFFEVYVINKAHTSCSHLRMRTIAPDGQYIIADYGPSPVLRPNLIAGPWKVQLVLEDGCNKYELWMEQ
jgi:hypothetical protein